MARVLLLDATHRWALRHALGFVERKDVVYLAVCALEARRRALAHWLLTGDAHDAAVDAAQCLHVACAEGCWTALAALLAKQQIHGLKEETVDTGATAFARAVAVHRSVTYVFPSSVVYRAAARGDVATIRWLHAASTPYTTKTAITAAARTRRLEAVQWLLDHVKPGELFQCWLRCDDAPPDVRAVGWICQTEEQVHFCAVSDKHGFTERAEFLWDENARVAQLPLAEPFADHGDRDALEKLVALPNAERLVSSHTIVRAAANGHLWLVQWLHGQRIHAEWRVTSAMVEAAANGHLGVVKWLYQFEETHIPPVMTRALESGELDVVRWLRVQSFSPFGVAEYAMWSAAARSRKLEVFRFLREECGVAFQPSWFLFMGIAGDLPLVKYVCEHILTRDEDGETFAFGVAKHGTLAALEYLVNEQHLWSRQALRAAIARPDGLPLCKYLYEHAQQRASRLGQPLTEQLNFSDIKISAVAKECGLVAATWLVQSVPEVELDTPSALDVFHPDRLPHTCVDVLGGDPTDLGTKSSAADVAALLIACIQHRPQLSLQIPWLPIWAVRANRSEAFDLLEVIGHGLLFTQATCDCVTRFSRNAALMVKLLSRPWVAVDTCSIKQWARKYDLPRVLAELNGSTQAAGSN